MRPLILKMELSLDGYCGTPDGDVGWIFRTFDDEFTRATVDLLGRAGVHVMGRVLYHDMAAHWPTSDEPFARPMNHIPKVVSRARSRGSSTSTSSRCTPTSSAPGSRSSRTRRNCACAARGPTLPAR